MSVENVKSFMCMSLDRNFHRFVGVFSFPTSSWFTYLFLSSCFMWTMHLLAYTLLGVGHIVHSTYPNNIINYYYVWFLNIVKTMDTINIKTSPTFVQGTFLCESEDAIPRVRVPICNSSRIQCSWTLNDDYIECVILRWWTQGSTSSYW